MTKGRAKRLDRIVTVDEMNNLGRILYNTSASNVWSRLGESFVDSQNSLKMFMSAVLAETGNGEVKDHEDFVRAFNVMSSRMHDMSEKFGRRKLAPLLEILYGLKSKFGIDEDEASRYLAIKSGLERNVEFAKRDAREWYEEEYRRAVKTRIREEEHQEWADEQRKNLLLEVLRNESGITNFETNGEQKGQGTERLRSEENGGVPEADAAGECR